MCWRIDTLPHWWSIGRWWLELNWCEYAMNELIYPSRNFMGRALALIDKNETFSVLTKIGSVRRYWALSVLQQFKKSYLGHSSDYTPTSSVVASILFPGLFLAMGNALARDYKIFLADDVKFIIAFETP